MSVSRPLLEQMSITLRQAGYSPSLQRFEIGGRLVQFPERQSMVNPSWKITLTQSDTARFLATMNDVEKERWTGQLGQIRERTNSSSLETEIGHTRRLRSVDRVQYDGPVYNLHVEGDESYVVNEIAVHNCWFARDALAKWAPKMGGTPLRRNYTRR